MEEKMKKVLFIILALCLISTISYAQIADTVHDLSSGSAATFNDANLQSTNVNEICVFCHTPHQPATIFIDPLWNHTLSAETSYGVYDSPTMDADTLAVGAIADVAGTGSTSDLCMSCHDGTVAVGSLYNDPSAGVPDNSTDMIGAANSAYIGNDLTNDHPVNFTFANELYVADGGLNDPAGAGIQALLIGGTVQCSSCHDPHDNTFGSFLVMSNAGSALCLTCHDK
jgi:predicted CXXCH cytochrome family protein